MTDSDPNKDRMRQRSLGSFPVFTPQRHERAFHSSWCHQGRKSYMVFDLRWFGTIILILNLPFATSQCAT